MKLLREFSPLEYETDDVSTLRDRNNGKITLHGILQKADTVNQNNRIYPKAILEREISNYQKWISERRSLGEADHPETSIIELKNVSHLITEAYMDGNTVYGTIELLDTPAGKILQSLVEAKVKLGISSRGVGSTVKQGDADVVQEDFQIICWDCVSEPSTPGAFMVAEGKNIGQHELKQVFNKSDRVFRAANDVLSLSSHKLKI